MTRSQLMVRSLVFSIIIGLCALWLMIDSQRSVMHRESGGFIMHVNANALPEDWGSLTINIHYFVWFDAIKFIANEPCVIEMKVSVREAEIKRQVYDHYDQLAIADQDVMIQILSSLNPQDYPIVESSLLRNGIAVFPNKIVQKWHLANYWKRVFVNFFVSLLITFASLFISWYVVSLICWRRRSKGCCYYCGYELAKSGLCTECGFGAERAENIPQE